MPNKEELQESVDELQLALDRMREEAEAEVAALREELGRGEEMLGSLRATTNTLTEGQGALERIYREREELLLERVGAEARRMAEAGERWEAERAQLTAELGERDHTIEQLETRAEGLQRQLTLQCQWLPEADRKAGAATTEIEARDRRIESLSNSLSAAGAQLAEARENRGQPIILGLLELLASRPGCWAVLLMPTAILWVLVSVINSIVEWLRPPESLLGT